MKKRQWNTLINAGKVLTCVICGELILTRGDATREHEPPVSRSPRAKIVGYAHRRCNSTKGALTIDEYREWQRLEFIRTGQLSK